MAIRRSSDVDYRNSGYFMNIKTDELVGLQRAEFSLAARIQDSVLVVQLCITILGIIVLFVTSAVGGYILGIAGAVLAGVWAWLVWKFERTRAQAERTRRATMLVSGLGLKLSVGEMLGLSAGFSVTSDAGKQKQDSLFYSSSKPLGAERLEEMLEETAFWSGNLMKFCASQMWSVFVVLLCVALLCLFLGMPLTSGDQLQQITKIVFLTLIFSISGDVLGTARKFSSAASDLQMLLPRIEAAKAQGSKPDDLILLLLDYNSAVEGAPVIPDRVYRRHHDKLQALWSSRT
jgi:hypothetical protein